MKKNRLVRPLIALVTASHNESPALARAIVKSKLAACVNIVPSIKSVYHWKGKIEQGKESLLIIKTTNAALNKLEALIKLKHSYDVPEFIVFSPIKIEKAYKKWLLDSIN